MHGPGVVVADVRKQASERRRDARPDRHEHARNTKIFRDAAGVQRTRAAERDQDELPGIKPPLERELADRARHVEIDDA